MEKQLDAIVGQDILLLLLKEQLDVVPPYRYALYVILQVVVCPYKGLAEYTM
jgi:hypothetical protein